MGQSPRLLRPKPSTGGLAGPISGGAPSYSGATALNGGSAASSGTTVISGGTP